MIYNEVLINEGETYTKEIKTKLRKVQQNSSDIYYISCLVCSRTKTQSSLLFHCMSQQGIFLLYDNIPAISVCCHYSLYISFFFFININSSQYSMKVFSLSIKFWSTSTSTSHILCIGFLVVFVLLTKKGTFYPDFVA